jgi:cytoskeletal protein CcmA (bactofilin family)
MQDFGGNAGGKQTLIEEGTHFKGSMTSNCPIMVRGRIDGDVESPSLAVSVTGAVHGRAKVGSLRSEGELSGEYDAETVQLSGTVRDKTVIRAKSLEVKLESGPGKMQVMFGECELSVGDSPVDALPEAEPAAVAADQDSGRRGKRKRDEEVAIVRESEAPKAP